MDKFYTLETEMQTIKKIFLQTKSKQILNKYTLI